jgi:hypothetical protein
VNRTVFALGILMFAAAVVIFVPSLSERQPCSTVSYTKLGSNSTEATVYFCPNGTDSPTYTGPNFTYLNVGLTLAIMGAILAAGGVLLRGPDDAPSSDGTWGKDPIRARLYSGS